MENKIIYALYRAYDEEPGKGYYWGKYEDPVTLAYACHSLGKMNINYIRVVTYDSSEDIMAEIKW